MSRKKSISLNPNLIVIGLFVLIIGANYVLQEIEIGGLVMEPQSVDFSKAVLYLPAVDDQGNGVLATLVVEAESGDGKELINIDKLVFWEDTQQSIKIAKKVACEYTGIEEDSIDVTYSITSEGATVVGGPSAGAALAVATIAVLEGREIDSSIIITGTILEDGSIGRVGGIPEKALAAQENHASLFLIPIGDATSTTIEPDRKCIEHPHITYCETVYRTVDVSVVDGLEMPVKEVSNVQEALEYFWIGEA
jgi:uncharacterized protein